jgi:predicted nucleotidyltransferase
MNLLLQTRSKQTSVDRDELISRHRRKRQFIAATADFHSSATCKNSLAPLSSGNVVAETFCIADRDLPRRERRVRRHFYTMISLVTQKKNEVSALCKQFKVRRLDLFGSAATENFSGASDLDFVVSFTDEEPREYARCYFSLANALEKLFQRRVDLVTERSIRNPYFREEIEQTRQPVYGA